MRTLPYGRHPAQRVRALGPDDGPVCVLVHGGFWKARYRWTLERALAEDLAARGWLAWVLEFRRLGPLSRGGFPQTSEDVVAGIDLLGDRADGRPVVAVGHSAGGHLALLAAARPGRVRLTGVVAQGGLCDLAEVSRLGLSAGTADRFAPGAPREADPAQLAPTGVPTLLVHGTADEDVPHVLSERYAAAAGDEAELRLLPGVGHMEHLDPASGAWAIVVDWLEAHRRDLAR